MEEELVFVGWWCWKADGHFSDIACRSDCDRCGGTGVDPERYVTVQGANAVYDLPSPCTGCTQSGGDR
jgi:hypothetical protein